MAVDRHAYTVSAKALAGRSSTDTALVCSAVLDPDIRVVDGRWRSSLDLSYPDTGFYGGRFGGDAAPKVLPEGLVYNTQPSAWIGCLFLDPAGDGTVWTGSGLLNVRGHRIADSGLPGYDGLYAMSLAVTHEWWEHTRCVLPDVPSDPAVIALESPLGESVRSRVSVPFQVDYLLLLPFPEESSWPFESLYVTDRGEVRPPRRVVPVCRDDFEAIGRSDRYRPRLDNSVYYRIAEVTPVGLLAVNREVFTGPGMCPVPAFSRDGSLLVISSTRGLPADALTIDGESFVADVHRVSAERFDAIHEVVTGYVGQVVVDDDGNGFVYDGSHLQVVAKRLVADTRSKANGFPVWSVALMSRAKVTPADVNVHGVVFPLHAGEAVSMGFSPDVRYVLLMRGRPKDQVYVVPFSNDDFGLLRTTASVGSFRQRAAMPSPVRRSSRSSSTRPLPAAPVDVTGSAESVLEPVSARFGGGDVASARAVRVSGRQKLGAGELSDFAEASVLVGGEPAGDDEVAGSPPDLVTEDLVPVLQDAPDLDPAGDSASRALALPASAFLAPPVHVPGREPRPRGPQRPSPDPRGLSSVSRGFGVVSAGSSFDAAASNDESGAPVEQVSGRQKLSVNELDGLERFFGAGLPEGSDGPAEPESD